MREWSPTPGRLAECCAWCAPTPSRGSRSGYNAERRNLTVELSGFSVCLPKGDRGFSRTQQLGKGSGLFLQPEYLHHHHESITIRVTPSPSEASMVVGQAQD